MRLTRDQVRDIALAVREIAGDDARVRLFGSRLRDELRVGDIDLLVACPRPVARRMWPEARIHARLQRRLGERRIDVLATGPDMLLEPVRNVARAGGLLLVACPPRSGRFDAPFGRGRKTLGLWHRRKWRGASAHAGRFARHDAGEGGSERAGGA